MGKRHVCVRESSEIPDGKIRTTYAGRYYERSAESCSLKDGPKDESVPALTYKGKYQTPLPKMKVESFTIEKLKSTNAHFWFHAITLQVRARQAWPVKFSYSN